MLTSQNLPVVGRYLVDRSVLCLGHPGMDGGLDAHVWLDSRGCTYRCIDVIAHNGCEELHDLNEPQDLGRWDVVLDHGTIEHCFHVSHALLNAANAVKPGGYIFHCPPLTVVNHGFWQVSPCLFAEFYATNGWKVEYMAAHPNRGAAVAVDGSMAARKVVQPDSWLYVVAQRVGNEPLKAPIQGKYL